MKRVFFILTHPGLVAAFVKESADVWRASMALARQVRLETTHGSKLYVMAEKLDTEISEARGAFKKLLGGS